MLIIEGPDLVGKTTLALKLQAELAARRYRHVYAHFTRLPVAFDKYWDYLPFIQRNVVQDRFYMSRIVYGRVFRNQELCTKLELRMLDGRISEVGGMTVVVTADDNFIRQQYAKKDRDEMYKLDGILKVNHEYARIIENDEMQYDIRINVEDVTGWPSTYTQQILEEYTGRQEEINAIISRRRDHTIRDEDSSNDEVR